MAQLASEAAAAADLTRISSELSALLRASGMHAALGYLNARTRFRFTGIYHVDPPSLRNIHLFDRENLTLNVSGNVCPLDDGYCGVTCGTGVPFSTSDSQRDPRLRSHPARDLMLSYAGVPLRMPNGSAWGTLCHFDVRPRLIPPAELPVLEAVMPLFADWVRERCGAA